MRNITRTILLTFSCLFLTFATFAQGSNPTEDVVNAIRNNRISDINGYFDNIVPVTINNAQSVYSHAQAVLVLKDFFSKNDPRNLTITDSGSPNTTSRFAIGTFTTPNGKYTLYVLIKQKDAGTFLIQEIKLNKE